MSKFLICVTTVFLMISCTNSSNIDEKSQGSEEDRKAIEQAYENWYRAWEIKDAKLAAQDYADNAVWINAFGMKRNGQKEIEKTLEQVFSMDFVMAGESKTVEKTITFLKPDVAIINSRVEREGQKSPSGEQMLTRQTSHLRVFVKTDGKWQIVSHLISDARDRENPQNH